VSSFSTIVIRADPRDSIQARISRGGLLRALSLSLLSSENGERLRGVITLQERRYGIRNSIPEYPVLPSWPGYIIGHVSRQKPQPRFASSRVVASTLDLARSESISRLDMSRESENQQRLFSDIIIGAIRIPYDTRRQVSKLLSLHVTS